MITLDCTGQLCPLPVIELGREISSLSPGDMVELVSDDPAAAVDVAAFCRLQGHELVETRPSGSASVTYVVRRGPSQPSASSAAASP